MFNDNRITEYGDDNGDESEQVPVLARSESQRAASRANGKRGRGPVTDKGKQTSSMNAVKHGLLAKRLAPMADFRGDRFLYRQIRRQLNADFSPKRNCDKYLVDGLALEYVQLVRVTAMIEAIQQPNPQSLQDGEELARVKASTADVRPMAEAAAMLHKSGAVKFGSDEAGRLATAVSRMVGTIEENWKLLNDELAANAAGDPAGGDTTGPVMGREAARSFAPGLTYDQKEDRILQETAALIGTNWARLQDQAYLQSLFEGRGKLHPKTRDQLAVVLNQCVDSAKYLLAKRDELQKKVDRATIGLAFSLAQAPDLLVRWSRYKRQIESTIAKKQRQLERH